MKTKPLEILSNLFDDEMVVTLYCSGMGCGEEGG